VRRVVAIGKNKSNGRRIIIVKRKIITIKKEK
jgi:hypothetical protein